MDAAGQGRAWTGSQLATRLATLNGVAPPVAHYAVIRATRLSDGSETVGYHVPDQAVPLPPAAWPIWLAQHDLLGPEQLRVALLLIRETLDQDGQLSSCVLERRRGMPDGPFFGDPARVEFLGPARAPRLYCATRDGRLQEAAPSAPPAPLVIRDGEAFAGEQRALQQHFGPDIQIVDSRDPTLFEDMVGLASIVHLRTAGGQELACGIGWHGTVPFVLVAAFPRFGIELDLPAAEEVDLRQALYRHGLIRHETRLDERGLAVLARRQGEPALFLLRVQAGQASVEPYQPATAIPGSMDQQRWMRAVETYERLVPLDHHRDGASDDLVVLTGDPGGHVWRHLVDSDGVEVWRRPADDAAVAAVYRERLPPGTLARTDGAARPDPGAGAVSGPEPIPPAGSLLAKLRAFTDATAALHAASQAALAEAADSGSPALLAALYALEAALEPLSADISASRLDVLLAELESGPLDPLRLVRELAQLQAGLHEELAMIRAVALQPSQWRWLTDRSPFGPMVEASFPACSYDLEEAASCLAFRRPSAAVFHCMKILERALPALGRLAAIPDILGPQRDWGEILAALAAAPPTLAPLLVHLRRVRRRWRSATLLPADKYTEAEAERVFHSVGAFLGALAARCDEHGQASSRSRSGIGTNGR